ncbi:MAG TPA: 50S ribosomal protein L15 [Acidiferrobacter sp.]|nr:50S ribosomal protein L15 [Acidiferrobacter sp.]
MRLNTIKPTPGRTAPRRVGRGGGSGLGKTCGRGHKGQRARAGGYHKVGFEGGQMPLQRRLPKFGFASPMAPNSHSVRLGELAQLEGTVDLAALKAANIVGTAITRARVFLSGTVSKPLILQGIAVTKGVRAAIEAAGGRIED